MTVLTMGEAMGVIASPATFDSSPDAGVDFCGAESNVAVGLARLGVDVTWVSRLGDDSFGSLIRRTLTGEGVHVVAAHDASLPTGLLLKEQRTPERTMIGYRRAGSAASALGASDVDGIDLAGVRHLHLSGITPAISPSAHDAATVLLNRARAAGATISFDVNYRRRLWSREHAAATLRPFVAAADLLFAAEDETGMFVGDREGDAEHGAVRGRAHALARLGPEEVVITRGHAGAVAVRGDEYAETPAREVPVVDTVGAGDAFVAGYLAEFLADAPLTRRLSTGTITAAFACMSPSDWAGLPTRSELELLGRSDPVDR
jgi:2-dehydro-3-deoxygluconokinase